MTEDKHSPHPFAEDYVPRAERNPGILLVKAELYRRADVIRTNAEGIASPWLEGARRALVEATEAARARGAHLDLSEYKRVVDRHSLVPSPLQTAYYKEANAIAAAQKLDGPDIDDVWGGDLRPGGAISLFGTGFGPSQGKVLAEVAANTCIELRVDEWRETDIVSHVDPIVGQVPLRPYSGRIWLQSANGTTSNVWPIRYRPIYSQYYAQVVKSCQGYGAGNHDDGVVLENCRLADDFRIIQVEHRHRGAGWSELRYPSASGQVLSQGYHIGVSGFGRGDCTIAYSVSGPKGIAPTYYEELGPWGFVGDLG